MPPYHPRYTRRVEIGPGSGALSREMARSLGPRGTYLGVELSEFALHLRGLQIQLGSSRKLPASVSCVPVPTSMIYESE